MSRIGKKHKSHKWQWVELERVTDSSLACHRGRYVYVAYCRPLVALLTMNSEAVFKEL